MATSTRVPRGSGPVETTHPQTKNPTTRERVFEIAAYFGWAVSASSRMTGSKLVALGLGGLCVYLKKPHLIRWATYWYSGLVVWNLMIVLAAAGPHD